MSRTLPRNRSSAPSWVVTFLPGSTRVLLRRTTPGPTRPSAETPVFFSRTAPSTCAPKERNTSWSSSGSAGMSLPLIAICAGPMTEEPWAMMTRSPTSTPAGGRAVPAGCCPEPPETPSSLAGVADEAARTDDRDVVLDVALRPDGDRGLRVVKELGEGTHVDRGAERRVLAAHTRALGSRKAAVPAAPSAGQTRVPGNGVAALVLGARRGLRDQDRGRHQEAAAPLRIVRLMGVVPPSDHFCGFRSSSGTLRLCNRVSNGTGSPGPGLSAPRDATRRCVRARTRSVRPEPGHAASDRPRRRRPGPGRGRRGSSRRPAGHRG
jgi:hypothetical protein